MRLQRMVRRNVRTASRKRDRLILTNFQSGWKTTTWCRVIPTDLFGTNCAIRWKMQNEIGNWSASWSLSQISLLFFALKWASLVNLS